ncbi:MAG: hypothetical protein GYB64_17550, partial [Chloroflexi bacterium]|nr:hypothetical protein [Chloroflexota bacterium]
VYKRLEQRLYSGEVTNPRELTELQEKVEELRRRHAELEEPQVEAQLMLEGAREAVTTAEADLKSVREKHADSLGALTDEQAELEERLDALGQEAHETRDKIADEHLELYDELYRLKGGRAVSDLEHSICTACGMQITTRTEQMIRRGRVTQCPNCGRILAS